MMSRYLLLTGLLLLSGASAAWAQAPGGGGLTPAATNAPLDGGASLLLAGGVALGLQRLRQRRR